MKRPTIVVTSINPPTKATNSLSELANSNGLDFIVIGDRKSPRSYPLRNCQFFNLQEQVNSGLKFARLCPEGHYARKNIGYLLAIREGAPLIYETDDDNIPLQNFTLNRQLRNCRPVVSGNSEWINIYQYFSKTLIWPRGLPLDRINDPVPPLNGLSTQIIDSPVQQGLADGNPDVDAVFRLLFPLPHIFSHDPELEIALGRGCWSPFNSQNTLWWPPAYPLLYLPFHCSFRMTDIWRSFVAQRVLWENDWLLLFHGATVFQERNEHNLMKDFTDEIPGYLHNEQIRRELEDLQLERGEAAIGDNMRRCYAHLISMGLIGQLENSLLDAWLDDIAVLRR